MEKRNALITGAAKRIGKAVAEHLAANGFSLAMHYSSSKREAMELQAKLIDQYPGQEFKIFRCNLREEKELEQLIDKVMQFFRKIDLLVNNASVFDPGVIRETSVQLYNDQIDINLKAPYILTRDYALNNQKGMIINFLDTRITNNSNSHAAYSISKVGLMHLTRMSALEFAPNIRVNGIAPGATLAPEGQSMDYLANLAAKTPMEKPGGLKPILQSIDYILDNENLTGQILFCDGGEQLL